MKDEDVNEYELERGSYCCKEVPGCFCRVGFPYERMCPDCRDGRSENEKKSYCICPVSEETK
jgi:hypothetical protein